MRRSARLAGVLAVLSGLGAAAAWAQPERPAPRERRETREGGPPLRGPAVRDEQPPGPGAGMTEEGEGRGDRIPVRVFLDAVRTLDDEGADEGIRLTDAQREKLRELGEGFQRERREYMEQHREEMQGLRARAGDGPGPRRPREGGGGPEMGEMDRPGGGGAEADGRAVRERLREIERGAPQPEGLYRRVWAELRPEQREAVEHRLERFRAERAREREDAYVRRRVPEGGRPQGGPPPRAGEPGAGDRRERLLRIFEQMSPDEQDALLERLEQRLRERGPEGGPPPPRRRGDRPPPPPPGPPGMEGVEVPREPGPAPDR